MKRPKKLELLTLGKKKMNKEGYDESIKMVSGKEKIDQELL